MKKLFIVIANLILLLLVTSVVYNSYQIYLFSQYPVVQVIQFERNVQREAFESDLDHFASQHELVLGRRIVEPNQSGKTEFKYVLYGKEAPPKDIQLANDISKRNSDLAASYLVFQGATFTAQLKHHLEEYGARVSIIPPTSSFENSKNLFLIPSILITVGILFLTYFSLIMVQLVKKAREIGIQRVSGLSKRMIYYQLIQQDTHYILMMAVFVILLSGFAFQVLGMLNGYLFKIAVQAFLLFNFYLFLLNLAINLIGHIYLITDKLHAVLKGKLPYRFLMSAMFIGQVVALFILAYNLNQSIALSQSLDLLKEASGKWDQEADLFDIKFGLAPLVDSDKEDRHAYEKWYGLIQEAMNHQDAFFIKVQRNPINQTLPTESPSNHGTELFKNVLFVSPNYIKREGLNLSEAEIRRLSRLKLGEFGLIIPLQFQKDQSLIESYFMEYLTTFSREGLENNSKILYQVNPISIVSNEIGSVFLYHSNGFSDQLLSNQQFLKQPIIVVISPESTGTTLASYMHWTINAAKNMKYTGYDQTINLLKKHDLYQKISYLTNSRQSFLEKMADKKIELITHLFATFFACLSSVILYLCMNQVYFNQFRRDILIRRLSGMNFWQNHQIYLALQGFVLTLSFGLLGVFFPHKWTAILTIAIFVLISLITLFFQMNKEKRQSLTLLKGA